MARRRRSFTRSFCLPLPADDRAYVNVPVDFIRILPPWGNWYRRAMLSNPEMNDLAMQIVPWAHQVREAGARCTSRSGTRSPAAAIRCWPTAQSSALSPLRLLALPLPLGYAMTAEAAMKLLIALTFMYLLCRRRYDELPVAIGAIAFGFCTFVITWLHFPIVTVGGLAAGGVSRDRAAGRTAPRTARFVFAVVVWTVMLFGGHPETVDARTFFGGLFALWIAFVERAGCRGAMRSARSRSTAVRRSSSRAAAGRAVPRPFAETVKKSRRFQELQATRNERRRRSPISRR